MNIGFLVSGLAAQASMLAKEDSAPASITGVTVAVAAGGFFQVTSLSCLFKIAAPQKGNIDVIAVQSNIGPDLEKSSTMLTTGTLTANDIANHADAVMKAMGHQANVMNPEGATDGGVGGTITAIGACMAATVGSVLAATSHRIPVRSCSMRSGSVYVKENQYGRVMLRDTFPCSDVGCDEDERDNRETKHIPSQGRRPVGTAAGD
ncbi:hypothetical protein LV564_18480 (plasmid) [Komagataeibacter nataicola]|uniref:Uncharacterized protein n=1 Tax=Komagataeibacter melomenusus TaxID=2766578 RepID=A0ABX2ACX2_9PROT|nr:MULTISPECIES: hypothetical protein [Komagataeibacter]MBV0889128.1 hypothetical protein [Komagataeibacter oboediens]MBV1830234.1 hypothetical protein [Komagataeibacter melomenusus]MCK9821189.1 hypothetical protein [Komagataeibacter oboediens]NPC65676.1 hypothetical protein [Komagataeibacter melomenusus]WEQ57688.1 hypothetical protein LV564_18480 [Komagataeibacter nataicola]